MHTRSSLASQILARSRQRRERELQDLLQSAGVDRPDLSKRTDSRVETRRKKKDRLRSQSRIQVVIESPSLPRHSGVLSEAKSKAQVTSGTELGVNSIIPHSANPASQPVSIPKSAVLLTPNRKCRSEGRLRAPSGYLPRSNIIKKQSPVRTPSKRLAVAAPSLVHLERDQSASQRPTRVIARPSHHSTLQQAPTTSVPDLKPVSDAQKSIPRRDISQSNKKVKHQKPPGTKKRREQRKLIRKAIKYERKKKSSKSRDALLTGLHKALEANLQASHLLSPNTLSTCIEVQIREVDGLNISLKKLKLVPRWLLGGSVNRATRSSPVSADLVSSTSEIPQPGVQSHLSVPSPNLLPFSQGVSTEDQRAERKRRAALFEEAISEAISGPLLDHRAAQMGTSRKASRRGDSRKETAPLHEDKMNRQRDSAHVAASHDHAMVDVSEEHNQDELKAVFPLTNECKHYTHVSQVDWDIQKYWHQRKSIFSLYDEGIRMTADAWFGVTPEPVANKVANDLAAFCDLSKTVVIDIFAGAGGNTIAFALSGRWSQVIGIEKDASVIACAQHNAAIYGVADQITFINGDSFSHLTANSSSIDVSKTVIFASPPWGGPGYRSDEVFNLNTMAPYSIKEIHDVCKGMDSALYLPRTSDLRQIARLAPEGKKVEVVQYCMEGASKALVAYIPAATVVTPS